MKTLWTPWRMDHVLGKAPKPIGCLFEPPGEAPSDKSLLLLYRDQWSVVLLNRFPYANGHLLVAPKRHVSCVTDLSGDEVSEVMMMVQKSVVIVKRIFSCDGMNIGCNIGETAGAGIGDHLHFHIVPRWDGDHNYMTVLAEVRTIPEHLENTYDKLLPEFSQLQQQLP